MEVEILEKLRERVIKVFMDMVVLAELRNRPVSGYDVIGLIHKEFHLLVSSGTVYSLLYYMERNGLIEGAWTERKRVYVLTDKGKETIKAISNLRDNILSFMRNLLSLLTQ